MKSDRSVVVVGRKKYEALRAKVARLEAENAAHQGAYRRGYAMGVFVEKARQESERLRTRLPHEPRLLGIIHAIDGVPVERQPEEENAE